MEQCFFKGCENPVAPNSWRCRYHRGRGRCSIPDCLNQAYARKLCARHGGKRQCQFEGCSYRARVGNLCSQHGTKRPKKECSKEGCVDAAQSKGVCVKHGGGRRCKLEGCQTFARRGGFCARHSTLLRENGELKVLSGVEIEWHAPSSCNTPLFSSNESDEEDKMDICMLEMIINMPIR